MRWYTHPLRGFLQATPIEPFYPECTAMSISVYRSDTLVGRWPVGSRTRDLRQTRLDPGTHEQTRDIFVEYKVPMTHLEDSRHKLPTNAPVR